MRKTHVMPFGASMLDGGGVRFALWAPGLDQVVLEHGPVDAAASHPMTRDANGWHRLDVAKARAGDSYRYRLPDGLRVPDPASRFNPGDVHGASQVIDPHAYAWRDRAWRGRPWEEAVIYELHIGTFTPEGTFTAAQRRLAELAELGVTAIELMPVADFPGTRNWGYDGVLLFNAHHDEIAFTLPPAGDGGWRVLLDTATQALPPAANETGVASPPAWAQATYPLQSRSFVLLGRPGAHA